MNSLFDVKKFWNSFRIYIISEGSKKSLKKEFFLEFRDSFNFESM